MSKSNFTERYCIDCRFAKSVPNLPRNKKTCQEGYGIRWDDDRACVMFEAGCYEDFIEPLKGATI